MIAAGLQDVTTRMERLLAATITLETPSYSVHCCASCTARSIFILLANMSLFRAWDAMLSKSGDQRRVNTFSAVKQSLSVIHRKRGKGARNPCPRLGSAWLGNPCPTDPGARIVLMHLELASQGRQSGTKVLAEIPNHLSSMVVAWPGLGYPLSANRNVKNCQNGWIDFVSGTSQSGFWRWL